MPAWITSLLREDVTVPMPSAASSTITSRPARASRRATARPITPAPITTHSTLSIRGSDPGLLPNRPVRWRPWFGARPGQSHLHYRSVGDDVFEQPVGFVSDPFPNRFSVSEALIMSGQLP